MKCTKKEIVYFGVLVASNLQYHRDQYYSKVRGFILVSSTTFEAYTSTIKMANVLRLCHTQNYDYFLEMDDNGRLDGVASKPLLGVVNNYIVKPFNITLEFMSKQGLGERIEHSDQYTGCLGRLQRNETDMLFSLVQYPLNVINVTQGLIISESGISMLSFYYHKSQITQQLTESFKLFSLAVWLLIFCSLLSIWVLLYARQRITVKMRTQIRQNLYYLSLVFYGYGVKRRTRVPRDHLMYQVITHFCKVGEIYGRSLLHCLLFILLSVMSLVVLHYFGTLIKTDLVVIPYPDILKSLDDMMAAGALPLFYYGFNNEYVFINAPAGSPERKFWDWATKKQPNLRRMQIYPGIVDVEVYLDDVLESKRVVLVDDIMGTTFRKIFCQFQSKNPSSVLGFMKRFNLRAWAKTNDSMPPYNIMLVKRPTSTETMAAFILSRGMSPGLMKKCKRIASSMLEHANFIHLKAISMEQDPMRELFGPDAPERTRNFEECMSDSVVTKEAKLQSLTYGQMFDLVTYMQIILAISLLVFLLEIAHKRLLLDRCLKKRKVRRRKAQCTCGLKRCRRYVRVILY